MFCLKLKERGIENRISCFDESKLSQILKHIFDFTFTHYELLIDLGISQKLFNNSNLSNRRLIEETSKVFYFHP